MLQLDSMIHRHSYRLVSVGVLAVLWPAIAEVHPSAFAEGMRRFDELKSGEILAGARLLAGGVWLGEEYTNHMSDLALFGAVSAQLDYALRSRWALSMHGSVGRITSRARYSGLTCLSPSEDDGPCTMDMNHFAWWSSLSVGLTKIIGRAPWTITFRGHGGVLLRRHTEVEIFEHGPASDVGTMHPSVNDDMADNAWHIGPLITVSTGIGYMLSPKSSLGLEFEGQISGLYGPAFITSAVVITFSRNLSLN